MKKKILGFVLSAALSISSVSAFASGAIPDHSGTSMDGIEIGTQPLSKNVLQYSDIFVRAGDQYGVDPNLLAAICMQESSGRNLSYREDGSSYPAWGIMQIEYTLEDAFAEFGLRTTGAEWTLEDRLNPEKSIMFAAYLISDSLIKYDCDYLKMIQAYNFGQTVLNRIIEANSDQWLNEVGNAVSYVSNWPYNTYGDPLYIQHILRYYHNDLPYRGAKVRINGNLIAFDDQYPLILGDGYTVVPVRGILEKLAAEVYWDDATRTATIIRDNTVITITVNSDTAYINNKAYKLDMPAQLINGRTMVPLRFLTEGIGFNATWNGDTRTVLINY